MTDDAGAVFWNALYPGHIHLPENTAYPCTTDGIDCAVVIVGHHEAVVVTDFSNDLITKKQGERTHIYLKKPIPYRPENTIATDFRATGNPETQHAVWTKEHLYKVYRKQSFTEITVGAECKSESSPESQDIGLFRKSLDRLLEIYRVAAVDPKANKFHELQRNSPTIRRCFVRYGDKSKLPKPVDRILACMPRQYPEFIQFSILEFAEDAVRLNVDRQSLAQRIGHHMEIGTQISESQNALIECFATLLISNRKNYRYAVIDAFSVAEVVAFDLMLEAAQSNPKGQARYDKLKTKNGRVTVKDAIHSFLPHILSPFLKRRPTLIGDLDKCRKLRHAVAHERAGATAGDAEFVLNTAQQLIFASEEYRGERTAT